MSTSYRAKWGVGGCGCPSNDVVGNLMDLGWRFAIPRKLHMGSSHSIIFQYWSYMGSYMGVSKNMGVSPQIIHFNRVFHDFHHPFLGFFPLFLVQHPYQESWPSFKPLNGKNTLPSPHRSVSQTSRLAESSWSKGHRLPSVTRQPLGKTGYMRNCLCHVGTLKMPGDIVSWKHHFSGLHVKSRETHSKKLRESGDHLRCAKG